MKKRKIESDPETSDESCPQYGNLNFIEVIGKIKRTRVKKTPTIRPQPTRERSARIKSKIENGVGIYGTATSYQNGKLVLFDKLKIFLLRLVWLRCAKNYCC